MQWRNLEPIHKGLLVISFVIVSIVAVTVVGGISSAVFKSDDERRQEELMDYLADYGIYPNVPSLNLSRGSRAGLSGFGLDTETVDPVCI
ncbi:hypothetical protein [Rhodococcus rhodochrous]|uniref:Uncharacterized protein n=1 Tax=Rhodococcus rhodochrous TaxID=1829 RepID=A0AA46X2F9_RHORH|nr:hypothetical protein [Rhodococcus rhodochrous]UZF48257.1 hypothetical protein KUM34_028325 [Rhodococcus rhodochrous]